MEDRTTSSVARRFLIVVKNPVVAEDLREFLSSSVPNSTIDVRSRLADKWGDRYSVAFFAVNLEELLNDSRTAPMQVEGTRLIVLDGRIDSAAYEGTGVRALDLPFRSEDLYALLAELGIPTLRAI